MRWRIPSLAPSAVAARRLVRECEGFLKGEASGELLGVARPAWACLHPVAHGDLRLLGRLMRRQHKVTLLAEPELDWSLVRRRLAGDLLTAARGDTGLLERIQRKALVPLELSLLEPATAPVDAESLYTLARAALASALRDSAGSGA
jgi:hypothetical protein